MFGHQDEPKQDTSAHSDQSQANAGAHDSNGFSGGNASGTALPPDPLTFGAPPQANPPTDSPNLLAARADDGQSGAPAASDAVGHELPTVGNPGPLSDLKQQALQQLAPLVGKLDQSPEEKFRTTMMMIQATDNQDLLPAAYEAANQISDEKAKAQALLDVVNEINYFSQK